MLSHQSQITSRACKLFFLPLLTLAFPLGVFLVFLQRLPAEDIQLASTDARLLQPVSTFWCAAQEITSGHPFYAYKVPKVPSVLKYSTHQHTLAFRFNLLDGRHFLLRYHLLPGSTIELAGCTNRSPAPFKVFYGKKTWAECLGSLTKDRELHHNSSEDDSSPSDHIENLPEPQDIHNGVQHGSVLIPYEAHLTEPRRAKRAYQMLSCANSILSGHLNLSQTNEEPSPACPVKEFPFSVTATREGKYYVLVHTDGLMDPGGVLIHVRLNRTAYELPENVLFCRSPSACTIPLTFGAEERVVVFVSAEPDAGAALFPVNSKCQPRASFYLVVFLLLPVLFALALLYAVRVQQRRRKAAASIASRETFNPAMQDTTSELREQVDDLKDNNTFGSPPSYREVVPERSTSSPPPPSYEDILRQPLVSVHRL